MVVGFILPLIFGLAQGIQLRDKDDARPRLHFAPARDWMNDPNGLVYWDGEYHLFFQRTIGSKTGGLKAWGHAVSRDLVHWEQLPDALLPNKHGNSIWSGSIVVDEQNTSGFQKTDGNPPMVAFFTDVAEGRPFEQRMAVSHDKGRTWEASGEAVIPAFRSGWRAQSARDPKVQWHAPTQKWIMVLWMRKGLVLMFESKNLRSWTQMQKIIFKDAFECPDFIEVPVVDGNHSGRTQWVLMMADGSYEVGNFNGTTYTPYTGKRFSEFGSGYAFTTFSGTRHKIQIGWIRTPENTPNPPFLKVPFVSVMSIPMTLELTEEHFIRRRPIAEISHLRAEPALFKHDWREGPEGILATVRDKGTTISSELSAGCALDISFRAVVPPDSTLVLALKQQDGNSVLIDVRGRNTKTRQPATVFTKYRNMPLSVADGENVDLQILVDWGTVEVFDVAGHASMAVYSSGLSEYSSGRCSRKTVELQAVDSATGGVPRLNSVQVYDLNPQRQ